MPDTILVTGGAGFIGSHLCEALLASGHKVLCLDNFNPFYPPARKRENLRPCLNRPGFTLIEADIRDRGRLDQVYREHKIRAVVHLAAMAGVRPSLEQPELYAEVNVTGTLNLLQCCRKYQAGSFIFASSSSVYGNNSKIPFAENDNVDHPISPYAATKKAGELLCHTWHHLYGIPMLCLRFFTVYGPRQRPDLAIHKFTSLLARGEELPVFGDGNTSRDYTYIDDTIKGVLAGLEYIRTRPVFEIINLGNDHSISLEEMIATLEQITGIKARRSKLTLPPGDVFRTHAEIGKARRLLGYDPATSFPEGIARFWHWWKDQREG
jgi:UDP-glucuronate 4-epimerase